VRNIDHTSVGEYTNLNFGYSTRAPQGSTWQNQYYKLVAASPLIGSHIGHANCVNAAYGDTDYPDTSTYFHAILRTAGNSENDAATSSPTRSATTSSRASRDRSRGLT
jgi:hypothetical protein